MTNAGNFSHSLGAGVVPVILFDGKLYLFSASANQLRPSACFTLHLMHFSLAVPSMFAVNAYML